MGPTYLNKQISTLDLTDNPYSESVARTLKNEYMTNKIINQKYKKLIKQDEEKWHDEGK